MSDSRLEKFIYAICSMDVSDLPVPLSRIEKLWNCLITGETPDFEPLSRNEKYLMAMLDRYAISNLPAPMSRSEKLLYKIAVGETDLSDVPGYLSRYEELLKYLIENGGIGFEYVLYTINQSMYTLYTTAEKPVKSAILKGQTLVNLLYNYSSTSNYEVKFNHQNIIGKVLIKNLYKGERCYINRFDIATNTYKGASIITSNNFIIEIPEGQYVRSVYDNNQIITADELIENGMIIKYQDGMENWDIPYFEGMQSVKMPVLTTTGKNLFDGKMEIGSIDNRGEVYVNVNHKRCVNFIPVKGNTTYTISKEKASDGYLLVHQYDENKNFIKYDAMGVYQKGIFTTDSNTRFVKFRYEKVDDNNFQIEEGSVSTTYEPFKSNILTANDDVELRGIGEVKDELNLMTGELSSNFHKITINGASKEVYVINTVSETTVLFTYYDSRLTPASSQGDVNNGVCDKLPYKFMWGTDAEGWFLSSNTNPCLSFRVKKDKLATLDINGLRQYLSENPLTFITKNEKTVKTVDLTVVDQDNQPTKLGTFENITHVALESTGLIPEVEMEVATRISKELASASPLMDDISMKQEQLNTTIDEQSNNVDATMIATTEIYEEIL